MTVESASRPYDTKNICIGREARLKASTAQHADREDWFEKWAQRSAAQRSAAQRSAAPMLERTQQYGRTVPY